MLQFDLFGQFDVRMDGQPVSGLEARKAQELLAFLLIQRSRAYSREFLAEMLWGQRAPAQSKKYLRQILWQVQSALSGHNQSGDEAGLLSVDGEWVRVDGRCDLWLDVAVFEQAYAQAEGMAGAELDSQRADSLRQAVQLYRGDLLAGCYEDWCIFERERLQTMYLAMLDKLIDCCQEHGQYEVGLGFGATILRYDRARERTHRRMMRLYYLAGDRTSALRQYDQLVRALREELDVTPSRRSTVLRDEIRADSYDAMPPRPPAGSPPGAYAQSGPASTGPADARSHLRHLHQSLLHMQRQIRQEIESIELTLAEI
jgi:DNA-binding SARP family transcriptional activator